MWNNTGILYKDNSDEFIDFVNNITKERNFLEEFELLKICNEWNIGIRIDYITNIVWLDAERDLILGGCINKLIKLYNNAEV